MEDSEGIRFTGERVVPNDMGDTAPKLSNYQRHLFRYVLALEFAAARRTLDAACGTGYGTALLSTVSSYALGLDNDERAISYAERHYTTGYPCRFRVADLEEDDLGRDEWETVVSLETIEHLHDPAGFLRRVREALVPDGFLVASLPIASPSEFHLHVYDYASALGLMVESGLRVTKVLGQHGLRADTDRIEEAPYLLFVCRKPPG